MDEYRSKTTLVPGQQEVDRRNAWMLNIKPPVPRLSAQTFTKAIDDDKRSAVSVHSVKALSTLVPPSQHNLLGFLVDSEIVLSTRYGKTMVFINKTLSTLTAYQQDLINRDLLSTRLIVGKVGSGMWCVKFNSTSNVLVCETQRKVNMYGCVSE
jgi:hypothetical protein